MIPVGQRRFSICPLISEGDSLTQTVCRGFRPLALRNEAAANIITAVQILLDPLIAFMLLTRLPCPEFDTKAAEEKCQVKSIVYMDSKFRQL